MSEETFSELLNCQEQSAWTSFKNVISLFLDIAYQIIIKT